MAVSRHLGFLNLESYTIRSADPENPTLEPNIMSLCCAQPELCYFKYFKIMAAVRHLVQGHRFWYQSKAHMQLPISH